MVARFAAALGLVLALSAIAVDEVKAGEIRFYKVNSKGQQSELLWVRKREEPGCHNFRRAKDIYRVAQIGFAYCSVYAKKDCPSGAEWTLVWKGKTKKGSRRSQPMDQAIPGAEWFFKNDDVREVRSWRCEP